MAVLLYLIQLVPMSIIAIWLLSTAEIELPVFIRACAWVILIFIGVVMIGFMYLGSKQLNRK